MAKGVYIHHFFLNPVLRYSVNGVNKLEIKRQRNSEFMLPKVVVYNSVSVDGAIKDFDVDMGLHYSV